MRLFVHRCREGVFLFFGMATATTTAKAPAAAAKAATPLRRDGAPGAIRSYRFDSAHNEGVDGESSHMADPVDARAFYADPVLKAAEREILSSTKEQRRVAAECSALLEHGREYDAMLGGGISTILASGGSDDDDKASTQSVAYLHTGVDPAGRSYSPFDATLDESAEHLLCDFGAPIMDGSIGLIDDDGAEILVEHTAPPISSWMSNGNLCDLDVPNGHEPEWASSGGARGAYAHIPAVVEFGVPGQVEVESLASLRDQYKAVFGKETNSNNRQWIVKRLEAFRNGDDFTPSSSRFSSPLSGEDTMLTIGNSRFKPQGSPKRAAGRRHVKSSRSTYDDDFEEPESPRSGASVKGRAKNAKGKRTADTSLPKSANKKVKVDDDEKKGARAAKATGRGKPGENGTGRRSKHHNPWALEEAEALVRGVAQCGGGKWADIKKLGFAAIEHRTAVDLKDKWRNLLRIAMLPQQSVKTVSDKKREIPQELLAKVRELAAKQAKAKAAAESRR